MDKIKVIDLIKILEKMPQDAYVLSNDNTGWLAHVREKDIFEEEIENGIGIAIVGYGESV